MLAPGPIIAGHRGASGLVRHENSIDAIRKTAEVGARWVEIDVRRLGDGTLVLMHDPTFAGHPLASLDHEDLRRRAARIGQEVPTLAEALAVCRQLGLSVDVELKEQGTEEDVVRTVRATGLPANRILYTSFHDATVAAIKKLHPEARTGLLLGRPSPVVGLRERLSELNPVRRLRACRADVAAPNWRLIQLGALPRLRAAGYPVWVWTVNRPARLRWLLDLGVDALITDYPDRALALRQDRPDRELLLA